MERSPQFEGAFPITDQAWGRDVLVQSSPPLELITAIASLGTWTKAVRYIKTKNGYELVNRFRFDRGIPQGDHLSGSPFDILMNPILYYLRAKTPIVKFNLWRAYADDLAVTLNKLKHLALADTL